MSSTRILLAELSPALRQALVPFLAGQVDVELVGDVSGAIEILLAVGETRAEVVVLGMPGVELPGIAGQLLDEYPQLEVLAVASTAGVRCSMSSGPSSCSSGR